MKNPISCICEHCGKDFLRDKAEVTRNLKNGRAIICSPQCVIDRNRSITKKRLESGNKKCSQCKITHKLEFFSKDKNSNDGRRSRCLTCTREHSLKYSRKNRKIMVEKFRESHPDYYQKNRDKILSQNKIWYENNRDLVRVIRRKAAREKRKNPTPQDRIKRSLRRRQRECLKLQGVRKTHRTFDLLGCTIKEFQKYIESKWSDGMCWENYGRDGWHLDHIIPINTFNLLDEIEQRKCFNYKNCRPLWAMDNLKRPIDGSDISEEEKNEILK